MTRRGEHSSPLLVLFKQGQSAKHFTPADLQKLAEFFLKKLTF